MNDRQKKGIAAFITAGLFAVVGVADFAFAITPGWVGLIITAVPILASIFGIVVTSKPE